MMTRSTQVVVLFGYVLVMAVLAFGLIRARHWVRTSMSDAIAQDDWQTYRADVVTMNEAGSVHRRVPRSIEPPAVVLMRDYFRECAAISVMLSTALYATFVLFVVGVRRRPEATDDSPKMNGQHGPRG